MGWTWAWHGHGMGSCTTWVWSGGWPTLDLFGRSLHQVPSYAAGGGSYHMWKSPRLVTLNAHNTTIWWSNLQCCFLFSEVYNPKGLNIFMFASCFLMCWFPGASYGPQAYRSQAWAVWEGARHLWGGDGHGEHRSLVSLWLVANPYICTWGPQMTAEVCYNSTNYG